MLVPTLAEVFSTFGNNTNIDTIHYKSRLCLLTHYINHEKVELSTNSHKISETRLHVTYIQIIRYRAENETLL